VPSKEPTPLHYNFISTSFDQSEEEAEKDRDKIGFVRYHKQIAKRGGWKRLLGLLALIIIISIVGLIVGLVVGLRNRSNS
jgi:hypothetical protein